MPVTAVRDEGALRMWVCRLPVHIGHAERAVFYETLRRIRDFPVGRQSRRPLRRSFDALVPRRGGRLCPPAGRTAFYGNLRRIRTASQILNARIIYRSHANAAALKPGVPWQAARTKAPVR